MPTIFVKLRALPSIGLPLALACLAFESAIGVGLAPLVLTNLAVTALGADMRHYLSSSAPLRSPCPSMLAMHTMSTMPGSHPRRKRLLVRPLIPLMARRADRVSTVSEQTRHDIVRLLGVPVERVTVIYGAAAALSWERAALQALAVYCEVPGQPGPARRPAADLA